MSGTEYQPGMAGLVTVVQELSLARSVASIQDVVRRAARALTGADGATFVLRDGAQCFYADEDAIAPLWKGQRFPLEACISGWAMLNRRSVVIEDISADSRIPLDAYRPTFVQSLAVVPIRSADPLGAIGNYWAHRHLPTAAEVDLLQALADSTAVALEHARMIEELEQRVAERTAELARLSLTDELTGIANRRGFLLLAEQARNLVRRRRETSLLLFVDVDGLKQVNDELGHERGDQLIKETAALLADAFRGCDVVGRWGGDEFVAFLPGTADAGRVRHRLEERIERDNRHRTGAPLQISVGTVAVVSTDGRPLVQLLAEADAAMYSDKRRRAVAAASA